MDVKLDKLEENLLNSLEKVTGKSREDIIKLAIYELDRKLSQDIVTVVPAPEPAQDPGTVQWPWTVPCPTIPYPYPWDTGPYTPPWDTGPYPLYPPYYTTCKTHTSNKFTFTSDNNDLVINDEYIL